MKNVLWMIWFLCFVSGLLWAANEPPPGYSASREVIEAWTAPAYEMHTTHTPVAQAQAIPFQPEFDRTQPVGTIVVEVPQDSHEPNPDATYLSFIGRSMDWFFGKTGSGWNALLWAGGYIASGGVAISQIVRTQKEVTQLKAMAPRGEICPSDPLSENSCVNFEDELSALMTFDYFGYSTASFLIPFFSIFSHFYYIAAQSSERDHESGARPFISLFLLPVPLIILAYNFVTGVENPLANLSDKARSLNVTKSFKDKLDDAAHIASKTSIAAMVLTVITAVDFVSQTFITLSN